ncbi:hypothetical protein [Egicoccus sp. AB-alg2]|uniref:hypothetical protein n=1 Tax=Egicoccus sp. AB-alg2 TaxID=3242693 RepID=UPI00359DE879
MAATVVLAACGSGPQERASLDDELADAAEAAAAGDGRLDLHDATGFDWDQLGVFPPYTSADEVERQLGVQMPAAAERQMNADSDVFLAFVDDGELVAWSVLGRGRIAVPPPAGVYEPAEAVFAVEPRDDGEFALTAMDPAS